MPQLISHVLVFLLFFRAIRAFSHGWAAWHAINFSWLLFFFSTVSVASSDFWIFKGPEFEIGLKVFRLIGWIILIVFSYACLPIYATSFLPLSGWAWGYLCYIAKELMLRNTVQVVNSMLLPDRQREWFLCQLKYYNNPREYYDTRVTRTFKTITTILVATWYMFAINKFDLDFYRELSMEISVTSFYNTYFLLFAPPALYLMVILTKIWITDYWSYLSYGYKQVGVIHRLRPYLHHKNKWWNTDICKSNKNLTFEALLTRCHHSYELPPYWCSWKQSTLDNVPELFLNRRIFHYWQEKYAFFMNDDIFELSIKYDEDFDYETIPFPWQEHNYVKCSDVEGRKQKSQKFMPFI